MTVASATLQNGPRVRLHLFGSFESTLDNQPFRLPTRKIEALLAFLVLHPEPHAREKLAALFWGDVRNEQARASLRYALARLRQTLGAEILAADRDKVQLNPQFPLWVDVLEFRAHNSEDRIQIYRGDLLADFYDDWILPEREHYRQQYLDGLLDLTQHYRSTSAYPRAIETAQRLLESDPANERAHQHLMFCFVAQGDRHAALRQYEYCASALRQELAVDPAPETNALYAWIKQTPGRDSSPAARITNLPIPLTSFVGREAEMLTVTGLLRPPAGPAARSGGGWRTADDRAAQADSASIPTGARMLTLTGSGGSGKTRLAIQAATDLIDAYPDGVWWVELASLADSALVPLVLATTLGVRESPAQPLLASLADFLREKRLLLVIDNCEHMLDVCAQLARALLARCGHLQILATSREALGFIGESVLDIAALPFPDPNALSLMELLLQYSAVRLFVARAAAVAADFELTPQNASAVARICARLDGIPLALELAAAQVKQLDVAEIAARLDDRFNFLTRGNRGALPRQQTLRALFDWSYDLLARPERIVFARLSIFAGGWTLAAAEIVCAGRGIEQGSVPDLILSLQEKSLVMLDARSSHSRQRLLETVRHYARDKLMETDAGEWVGDRHLAFFLQMAEGAELNLERAERGPVSAKIDEDLDNLRAAVRWSLVRQPEAGLRLVGPLLPFFTTRHVHEGYEWTEQVLATCAAQAETSAQPAASLERVGAEAKALTAAGFLAFIQGDYDTAQLRLAAAQIKAKATGDPRIQCNAKNYLGTLKLHQGDPVAARALHEQSVVLARQAGDLWMLAYSLWFLGDTLTISNAAQARLVYEESLPLFREAGDRYFAGLPMASLAHIAAQEGDYVQARDLLEECVAIRREENHGYLTVIALNSLAAVMCYQGDYEKAAALCVECLSLSRTLANKSGIAWSLRNLGETVAGQGDAEHAKSLLQESLGMYRELDQKRDAVQVIECLAEIAFTRARPAHAMALWGAADGLRATLDMPPTPYLRSAHDQQAASARSKLGVELLETEFAAGRKLTFEMAIELALSE